MTPDVGELAAAQHGLADYLLQAGCAADVLHRAELVIEEVVMNIITHGRPGGADMVRLQASCAEDAVHLTVEDNGAAFDTRTTPPRPLPTSLDGEWVGGFGLRIIHANADGLTYERTPDAFNRLCLRIVPR